MKPKTMILMGLAITCGLGASWMTSRLLAGRQSGEEETVTILVAKSSVNVGDLLKKPDEIFVFKQVAVKDVPEGAVKDFDALKDKIMKKGLRKGDHITPSELYGSNEQLEIPEGHEAVGLKVTVESSASGFASLPRSRVNVLLTVRVNNNDINLSYVQVLLEDVLVLAADTTTDREKGITSAAQVVTLALSADDVKRVTGAKAMGEMSLSLRKPGDHTRTDRPVMTFAEIKASQGKKTEAKVEQEAPPVLEPKIATDSAKPSDKPSAPEVTTPVAPKVTTETLTIVNGGKQDRVQYRRGEDGRLLESDDLPPAATETPADPAETPRTPAPSRSRKSGGPSDL